MLRQTCLFSSQATPNNEVFNLWTKLGYVRWIAILLQNTGALIQVNCPLQSPYMHDLAYKANNMNRTINDLLHGFFFIVEDKYFRFKSLSHSLFLYKQLRVYTDLFSILAQSNATQEILINIQQCNMILKLF